MLPGPDRLIVHRGSKCPRMKDTASVPGERGLSQLGPNGQMLSWLLARRATELDRDRQRGAWLAPDPWPGLCSVKFAEGTLYVKRGPGDKDSRSLTSVL